MDLLNTLNDPFYLADFKKDYIFVFSTFKNKLIWKYIFSILNPWQCSGEMRRLDPGPRISGQSWSLSIYLCRDWNNYYRIGYSPPGHPLSTSKKGEKYTWDKILSRRLAKMLNKVGPIHHDSGDIINFWTLHDAEECHRWCSSGLVT